MDIRGRRIHIAGSAARDTDHELLGYAHELVRELVRTLGREGAVFALLAGFTLSLHSALSAEPRMLLPVVPVGMWLVAWACSPRDTGARS